MKAYVHKIKDGKIQLGTDNGKVTKDYTYIRNLLTMGVVPWLKVGESALVEVFHNWDRRYGVAVATYVVKKTTKAGSYMMDKIPPVPEGTVLGLGVQ